jgi:DNA-binding transcriptional MerR regulator
LWTRKEIANYYGVHTSTIGRWEKAGLLPTPKKNFGWKLYDRQEVLDAFQREQIAPQGLAIARKKP